MNALPGRDTETLVLAVVWITTLVGSITLYCVWVGNVQPENLHYLWIEAFALATVPGKLAIFSGLSDSSPLDPWGLALLGTLVDVLLATTLALGLVPFMRLPGLGTWLRSAHARARHAVAEYPGLRRMAFWGAALFVAMPLPGSGWMGGTFAGQLLGLSRRGGVAAIAVGTSIVSAAFAAAAVLLGEEGRELLKSPWIYTSGFLVLAAVAWLLWRRFRVLLSRS